MQRSVSLFYISLPVLHQTQLPLSRGVLDWLLGAVGSIDGHPLGEAGAGVTQLVGRHVTCGAWRHTGGGVVTVV